MKHPGSALVLLLLSGTLQAQSAVPTGVGGGGWLHAGAYHPTDPDVIVIGTDVSGIYRTDDGGESWLPWNQGLTNEHDTRSDYVEDLIGVARGGFVGFYAATHGGIYRAAADGTWEWLTPPSGSYCYRDSAAWRPDVIPFSALDWDGAGLLVAGAGRIRWEKPFETNYYPGLEETPEDPENPHGRYIPLGDFDEQYTLWTLDLDTPGAAWLPIEKTKRLGAARDVTVATVAGLTRIAVATPKGIFLQDVDDWTGLHDLPVTLSTGIDQPSLAYGQQLNCWSLHLTDRGTLYGAFRRLSGNSHVSGVYRIPDITAPTAWQWVGDGSAIPPYSSSLAQLGRNDRSGVEHSFDPGWYDSQDVALIFHPVVSPSHPDHILIHTDVRLHVTDDGGDSWQSAYTSEQEPGAWRTSGFNELCTRGVAFLPSGQEIHANGDCGTFISTDTSLTSFRSLLPEIGSTSEHAPDSNVAWLPDTAQIHVRPGWQGLGDAIFVNHTDHGQLNRPGKLFMYLPGHSPEWTNITGTIDDSLPGVFSVDHLLRLYFLDFTFVDDSTCFTSYGVKSSYSHDSGYQGAKHESAGVLKGEFDGANWIWSQVNNGLSYSDGEHAFNSFGAGILHHPPSSRLFLATRNIGLTASNAVGLEEGEALNVQGGLYALDLDNEEAGWQLVLGGAAGGPYRDFRSLARSPDGALYAGTRGLSQAGRGTVLRCAGGQDPTQPSCWQALANETGSTFGYGVPEVAFWTGMGTLEYARRSTWARALAVAPWPPYPLFVGLGNEAFSEHNGLWAWWPEDGWHNLSLDEPFVGMAVDAIAFSPVDDHRLVIGTDGQEIYYLDLPRDLDAGPGDAAVVEDAATVDSDVADVAVVDGTAADFTAFDAVAPDRAAPDVGPTDTSTADAGTADAGTADARADPGASWDGNTRPDRSTTTDLSTRNDLSPGDRNRPAADATSRVLGDGCSCDTRSGSPAALVLLGLGLVWRRRRDFSHPRGHHHM